VGISYKPRTQLAVIAIKFSVPLGTKDNFSPKKLSSYLIRPQFQTFIGPNINADNCKVLRAVIIVVTDWRRSERRYRSEKRSSENDRAQ
jgi:hypothetical protein